MKGRSKTLTVGDPGLMTRADLYTLDGVQVLHHLVVHVLDNFLVERGNLLELVKPLGELFERCSDDLGVLPLRMQKRQSCTMEGGIPVLTTPLSGFRSSWELMSRNISV